MTGWEKCKNILCIRADNMGDLIMSYPAIRALKETFGAKITVLTSSMGKPVTPYLPAIDEVIVYDLPWVRTNQAFDPAVFDHIVKHLRSFQFDAAVIFTVFSQNPLPSAMLAYLAGIPLRLAYCRENPYQLLTHWIPEQEPYSYIRHQVIRDLELVEKIGAKTTNQKLSLHVSDDAWYTTLQKLKQAGVSDQKPWLVLHAPVSEQKREFPMPDWAATGRQLIDTFKCQLLLTGASHEAQYTTRLQQMIGKDAFSVAGLFNLEEFITLIMHSPLLLSVNTASIHIAAAVNTPVVVLYALTNPQHVPWKVPHKVLYFDVPAELQSRNEVLRHVYNYVLKKPATPPSPADIVNAVKVLLGKLFNAPSGGVLPLGK